MAASSRLGSSTRQPQFPPVIKCSCEAPVVPTCVKTAWDRFGTIFGRYHDELPQLPDYYYYNSNIVQGMGSSIAIPTLPQEIIDQIIDEVAYTDDDTDTQQTLDNLKSCSLVSKAFHGRSRSHIFSTVNLIIDRSAQKRAGRLIQLLRKKDDRTPIIQNIRRFNLVFEFRNSDIIPKIFILSGMTKPFIRVRSSFLRTLEAMGLRQHNINQVMDMMEGTLLTHFNLGSRRGFVRWAAQRLKFDNKLLQIVAKPSLRSLHLHNLLDFPEIYVWTAFQSPSLTELRLSYLLFSRGQPLPVQRDEPQRTFSKIEKMELRFISYRTLLAILRTLERNAVPSGLPTSHIHPIYSHIFSRIRTLSVSIPKSIGEQESLWDIMQSAASSLTTLKIESYGNIDTPSLEPISLAPFKALKRLDFSLTMFREDTDIGIQELYLANFLLSATSPMLLESINFTFTIAAGSHGNVDDTFRPSIGWTLLDRALNNPLFVNLTSVVFNIKTDMFDNGIQPSKGIQVKETSTLLPIMTASPSVDTRIYLSMVKGIQRLPPGYHFEL